jgi:hypothetical protein
MGDLIYLVRDPLENHTPLRKEKPCTLSANLYSPGKGPIPLRVIRNQGSKPSTFKEDVEYSEDAKAYYRANSILFFFGGFFMYVMAGVATMVWDQMWSALAFISLGGLSWIMAAISSNCLERHQIALRYYNRMGYQTSEELR